MLWPSFLVEALEGRSSTRVGRLIPRLLFPCSLVFAGVLWCRHWAYDRGWLSAARAPLSVISVGNIVAGGVGKTPIAALLARALLERGVRVAVALRGYGSVCGSSKIPHRVDADRDLPSDVGDEPLWWARTFPQIDVWVGSDRRGAAAAAHQRGARLLILEDGMQHRRLHRDREIVVVDAERPLGTGRYLPAGSLRDLLSRLQVADLVVINGAESEEAWAAAEGLLRPYTAAPRVGVCVVPRMSFEGRKVALFCAVGHPDRVARTVRQAGGILVAQRFLADHAPWPQKELAAFAQEARQAGADLLVCTEKDAVKIFNPIPGELPLHVLSPEWQIRRGGESWDTLIEQIVALSYYSSK